MQSGSVMRFIRRKADGNTKTFFDATGRAAAEQPDAGQVRRRDRMALYICASVPFESALLRMVMPRW